MGKDPGSIPLDDPLALLLTWTTYGSWLPGDVRGWVEKPGRFREPDAKRGESEGLTAALGDDYDEGVGSSPCERG
jgi:hypothetical protein